MNAIATAAAPYLNSTGLYLLRGWVLYAIRNHRTKVIVFSVWGFIFLMVPVMSYQAGASADPATPAKTTPIVKQVQINPPLPAQVASVASVAPPAPPPTPVVKAYSAVRSNGYAYGNCTYYVANRRTIPRNWGNARNWLYNAQRAGFATGRTPRVGAIAWTSLGYYGHVAIVEEVSGTQVRVSEMNYAGWNRISTRWAPASEFQYIY